MRTQDERIEQVQALTFKESQRLIYEWVKTGQISLREYRELEDVNRCSTN